jgi:Domain of unknown function (DUF4190)/HAAS
MEKAMNNVHTDRLVEDYLMRFDSVASVLPTVRRAELISEIRDHLQEGLREIEPGDEAAVRNLLERLGSAEEIVSAAVDETPSAQVVAPPTGVNGYAIASVLLGVLWILGVGSVFALIFGYRARREIKNSTRNQPGWGLATAGIVLGWIGVAIVLLGLLGAVGLIATSGGGSGGGTQVPVHTPSTSS